MSGFTQLLPGSTMGDVQAHGIDFVMRRGGAGTVPVPLPQPKAVSLIALQGIGANRVGNIDFVMSRRHDCTSAIDASAAGSLDRGRRLVDMPPIVRETLDSQRGRRHISPSLAPPAATNMVTTLANTSAMADLIGVASAACARKRSKSPVWGCGPGLRRSSNSPERASLPAQRVSVELTRSSPRALERCPSSRGECSTAGTVAETCKGAPAAFNVVQTPRIQRMVSAPALSSHSAWPNVAVDVDTTAALDVSTVSEEKAKPDAGGLRGVVRRLSTSSLSTTCSTVLEEDAVLPTVDCGSVSASGACSSAGTSTPRLPSGLRAMRLYEARLKAMVLKEQKKTIRLTERSAGACC